MKDVIEVGEYVRTKSGHIARLLEKTEDYYYFDEVVEGLFGEQWILSSFNNEIKKHSKQLIDLIECGDYVNEKYVAKINTSKEGKYIIALVGIIEENDIKTILTKEQYNINCYTVKGEE